MAGIERPPQARVERELIDQLRSTRVLVAHPDDADGDVLVRHLRRIGCQVQSIWPPPARLPKDLDAVFLLLERSGSDVLPWPSRETDPPLIAIVDYENPTLLKGLLDSGALAVLNKPIRATGLLSTLMLARALGAYDRRMQVKIRKLEDQLRMRRAIERATRMLMQQQGLSETDSYAFIRIQATRSRNSIGNAAMDILNANDEAIGNILPDTGQTLE